MSAKLSQFADVTKLCHRARNPDDIMELQEDINKLVEWANKWQMSFNVDKSSVLHIGHNNKQSNYTYPINSCPQQISSEIWESSSPNTSSGKNKQRKAIKRPTEYRFYFQFFYIKNSNLHLYSTTSVQLLKE